MANDNFKPIASFKKESNVPKTYEQFILEEQQLTPEQQQDLYPDLVHEDISEPKGYGPCRNRIFVASPIVSAYGFDCPCNKQELLQQLSEAEREICQLKNQARGDMDSFWDKFKEYDQVWENYRSFVNDHLAGNDFIKNCKGISSLALIKIPGASKITDLYWNTVASIAGKSDAETMKRIYNDCIVGTYNRIKDWHYSAKSKYN